MPLNPNIILQGQQANVMNALSQGNQAAAQTLQLRDQNKLRDLYATQGAGIANGDQNALNALAGIDPQAALGVQDTRLGMENTRSTMRAREQTQARLSREEQRAIEDRAATLSAAERAAEAAKIEDAVKMGLMIQTPEQWDQMAQQNAPELVGMFDQREALAAKYMSVAEVLKSKAPPEPADEYGRYAVEEANAGRKPLSRIEYAQAKKGQEIIFGPDGNPIVQRGGVGSGKALTEGQSKDVVFSTRAEAALPDLDRYGEELTSIGGALAGELPYGGYLQGEEYQKAKNAGQEFVTAILRKDTGAAQTPQEEKTYGELYIPQPGDKPALLARKKTARKRAVIAMKAGLPANAIVAQERALLESTGGDLGGASEAPLDFAQMSDEELDAYIQENSK